MDSDNCFNLRFVEGFANRAKFLEEGIDRVSVAIENVYQSFNGATLFSGRRDEPLYLSCVCSAYNTNLCIYFPPSVVMPMFAA